MITCLENDTLKANAYVNRNDTHFKMKKISFPLSTQTVLHRRAPQSLGKQKITEWMIFNEAFSSRVLVRSG